MIDLDEVIRTTGELKPLPASVARLSSLVAREDVDLREVADVVQYDQALTARLLRSANSAMLGSRHTVTTVKDAVVRLGSGLVLSFAIASNVRRDFEKSQPGYGLAEGALWRRSVAAALAAELIKSFCRKVTVPAETFTAALLHEVGRLVLGRFLEEDVRRVLEEARKNGHLDEVDAESQVLGVHHAEIGAMVAQKWNLPASIVHAIKYFPHPDDGADHRRSFESGDPAGDASQHDAVCDAVHLASAVSRAVASAEKDALATVQRGALERLGIDEATLTRIVEQANARLETVLQQYSG